MVQHLDYITRNSGKEWFFLEALRTIVLLEKGLDYAFLTEAESTGETLFWIFKKIVA